MSLAWYIRRLKSMSPGEVLHRLQELALKVSARALAEGWERYASEGRAPVIPGLRKAVESASPAVRAAISDAAKRHVDGRFSALGCDWPRRLPGVPITADLWRLDPVTGRLWPGADAFTFDIQYRHERRFGDIKYVWELNRLQFLQPLSAEVALTGNPRALALIEDIIASWYAANPPFRGVGWNSGIECALRAISLLVASSLVGDRLSSDTVRRVRAMLAAHAFWIARFPSRFSSANNHLVAEAAAMFLVSIAMPDLRDAAAHASSARDVLVREASLQIHADGAPAEQSPTYGAFTAEFVLLSAFAAKATGSPLPESVTRRLGFFATYIAWLSDARGRVPAIGDDDEGRVLSLGAHEACYAVSVARAAAGFVGHSSSLPPVAPQLRDACFPGPAGAPEPQGLETFADGGLTVVRETRGDRPLTLALDHGPLGYLSIAAHGHADALAIVAAVDGRPLLVDPGTYLYHSGGEWRDWFRGTAAHNTLSLRGINQSEISGAFNWRNKANARLDDVRDGPDWRIVASHDGYEHAFGVRHERTVSATDSGFAIRDRLIGTDAPLPVEIAFQLAADCDATQDRQTLTIRIGDGAPIRMHFDTPGEVSLARGGTLDGSPRPHIQGGGGWVSPAFGMKHPAWRVAWRGRVASTGAVVRVQLS